MPWNNQGGNGTGGGGGPWGSPPGGGSSGGGGGGNGGSGGGGQSPWGRPSGAGGPPDLEDLVRRLQDRVRQTFPGGFGTGKGVILALAALALLWFGSGLYRVQPDEQGVVLRFGAWVRTEQPGLRYHLPSPIESAMTPKVTLVNRTDVGFRSANNNGLGNTLGRDVPDESLMLTGDENIIDIDFTVFWVINDAGKYLFKVRDPDMTVKKAAESAMREVIGRTDLQPALTEARQSIETSTHELLQRILDEFQTGVRIVQVQLQKADPPAPVVDAFNDVQRARADKERLRNEAEAYRNDIIPRARGDAERLIQESQAYREQVLALAQGDTARYSAIYQAYNQAREVIGRRMYLETMESVLKGAHKVILDNNGPPGGPHGGPGGAGVLPYLPLDRLFRSTPAAPPANQPQR